MIREGDGALSQLISDGLCPRCHTVMPPVEVHGHVQCTVCKLIINECCQGETSQESIKENKNELD